MTPWLKDRLETEARAHKRSLTQELESRLRTTFEEDDSIRREFAGDRETLGLLRLIGHTVDMLQAETGQTWIADRYTFDQVRRAVPAVLDSFKPAGEGRIPDDLPIMKATDSPEARAWIRARMEEGDVGAMAARLTLCRLVLASEGSPADLPEGLRLWREVAEALYEDLRDKSVGGVLKDDD
jgi:hypothetical protein